jgi:monovalent cation/hydrogen antiporter
VTLVLQGLTLPSLIRVLGVAASTDERPEEREARRTILQAALDYVERARENDEAGTAEVYDVAQHYRNRLTTVGETGDGEKDVATQNFYSRYLELSRDLLGVERQKAIELRNRGRIGDDLLRQIEHELDLSEARLKSK